MESSTKNRLTSKQIQALSQQAFGTDVKEYAENCIGEFNTIYIIKLADREVVLKIAPKDDTGVLRYEKNAMQTEVDALRLIKAKTDIPVPEVLFYSKQICDFDYFFAEKLQGENFYKVSPELSAEQNSKILFRIGQYNRQINEIRNKKFGSLTNLNKQTNRQLENCFFRYNVRHTKRRQGCRYSAARVV